MTNINKTHSLFDGRGERVTTKEMHHIYEEIYRKFIGNDAVQLALTTPLPCKKTHGDIDIVYHSTMNVPMLLVNRLAPVEISSNGDVFSILFRPETHSEKLVQVDFIKATPDNFMTKLQYYSYNDLSGIIGMMSKKLHFKYGSEGFFKRFRDRKGNWHDLLISNNLMDGQVILGFNSDGPSTAASHWNRLETYDDVVEFVLNSPMFHSELFEHDSLNQSDKKSMKRPVIEYVVGKLRASGQRATITDEDFFFRSKFPDEYNTVTTRMNEIDSEVARKSDTYNGRWVMDKFHLSPGPLIGGILTHISNTLGESLDSASEEEVTRLVKNYIKETTNG